MTLDVEAKFFLDALNAIDRKSLPEMGAVEGRKQYDARPQEWSPEYIEVFSVEEKRILVADNYVAVRIYRPFETEKLLPVLVFYHGGGMVIGTLDGYDTLCRQLAVQAGCIIVSVDYRLAPEHKFPAAVDDAYAAFLWVADNALTLGIDKENIAVGGDSAGGNLAAVVAILVRDNLDRDKNAPKIKHQVLIYPATAPHADADSHFRYAKGYFLERDTVLWFHDSYINNEDDRSDFRYAPLIVESMDNLPPALVVVAGHDVLRDEGVAYAERLEKSGVDVELVEYKGMFHPFISLAGVLSQGKEAITLIANHLQKVFDAN